MYNKSDMVFTDYKWIAKKDFDNPVIIGENDYSELNHTEGYEMLYYIRSLARTWGWKDDAIRACQKLEKTIRLKVPENIRKHTEIKRWIEQNFKSFWDTL